MNTYKNQIINQEDVIIQQDTQKLLNLANKFRRSLSDKDVDFIVNFYQNNQEIPKLSQKQKFHLNHELIPNSDREYEILKHDIPKIKSIKTNTAKINVLKSYLDSNRKETSEIYKKDDWFNATNGTTQLSIKNITGFNDYTKDENLNFTFERIIKILNQSFQTKHIFTSISCNEILSKIKYLEDFDKISKSQYHPIKLRVEGIDYHFNLTLFSKVIKDVSRLAYGLGIDNIDIELCVNTDLESNIRYYIKIYPACNSHNCYGIVQGLVEYNTLFKPILEIWKI